ncbi:hypothetical protein GCM10027447_18410 [Glycomyces halotolerans]
MHLTFKRTLARLSVLILTLGMAVIGSSAPASAADNTLTVNVGDTVRPVTHVASGGLYGVDTGSPSLEQLRALRPTAFVQPAPDTPHLGNGATEPCCDSLEVADGITNAGAKQYIRMPDIYPSFPYPWDGWADWEAKVRDMVQDRLDATGTTNIAGWELWNEPELNWDDNRGMTFNQFWTRTHDVIRSLDSTTPIAGPSWAWYESGKMRDFLVHARDTGTLPDVIVWHSLGEHSYNDLGSEVDDYRALENELGISPRPISINEYASSDQVDIPSIAVHYLSVLERHGVQDAMRPYWFEAGTFNGLFHDGQPTASYWVYRWYADMSGRIVQTVPESWLDGVASYDASRERVNVVFGGDSGTNNVRVNGLGDLGGQVSVQLSRTNDTGRHTNQPNNIVVSTRDYTVSGGSIDVAVPDMDAEMAYQLLITPASGAPAWQRTYEAENANVNFAETLSSGSASNGYYVGRIDNDTDMRTHSFVDFLVEVPSSGSYTMAIRYANGTGSDSTHGLAYNGGAWQSVTYPPTGDWGQFDTVEVSVDLDAGHNAIRLAKGSPNFDGGVGYAELDSITLSGGGTTPPPDDDPSGDTVLLQSVSAEKCIDVPGGDTTDGTEVQLYSCYEGENQQFTETSGQELQVLGKCLDAPSGSNGDLVQIYTCHGGDNQKWTFNSDGTISNVEYSNVCLDVYSSNNGAPVQLYSCWGGDNQQWNRI